MPMTDEQLTDVARDLARKIFVIANDTAHTDLVALKNAVGKIDTAMNATTTQLANARPGEVFKQALLEEVKSVAPKFSNAQAGFALVFWVAKEVGFDF